VCARECQRGTAHYPLPTTHFTHLPDRSEERVCREPDLLPQSSEAGEGGFRPVPLGHHWEAGEEGLAKCVCVCVCVCVSKCVCVCVCVSECVCK
jgi:hypothetical protein